MENLDFKRILGDNNKEKSLLLKKTSSNEKKEVVDKQQTEKRSGLEKLKENFVDFEGGLICEVQIEVEEICNTFDHLYDKEKGEKSLKWFNLTNLVLIGPTGEKVDLRDIIGTEESSKLVVFLSPEYDSINDSQGGYDRKSNSIYMDMLKTPLNLATLFHEIGHHKQSQEDNYRKLYNFSKLEETPEDFKIKIETDPLGSIIRDDIKEIENIITIIPDAKKLLDFDTKEVFDKIYNLSEMYKESFQNDQLIRSFLEEIKGFAPYSFNLKKMINYRRVLKKIDQLKDRNIFLKNQLKELQASLKSQDIFNKLNKIKKLPQRILERDATRRAFQWIRDLKQKHKIDLLRPIYKRDESGKRILTNIKEKLETSLETYCLDREDMSVQTEGKEGKKILSASSII